MRPLRHAPREAAEARDHERPRPRRGVVALICVTGLLATIIGAWAADRVHDGTEKRLLDTQTRQAAAVLASAVLVIEQPLRSALAGQASAGGDGAPAAFRRGMAGSVGTSSVGEGMTFSTASLWRAEGPRITRRAMIGGRPGVDPRGERMQRLLRRALDSDTFVVERIDVGDQTRIVYVVGDDTTGFVAYAERAIPKNRRTPYDRDSAFAQLHYALYVGQVSPENLAATDVDPAELPLDGTTATTTIPFGDTVLTIVAEPRDRLGSLLSQWLALIVLVGGALVTLVIAMAVRQLVVARVRAEDGADMVSALYEQVDTLYEEQRELSLRLQRALLPAVLPESPLLEVASEYVAAAHGIEIGGDWYSVVLVDDDHFGFVVGDVSGHGIDAVAVMARARFTLRAYLLDGNGPAEALEKCSRQFDIVTDDHMATVLVGVGDLRTGEVVLATAGHPAPVVGGPEGTSLVEVAVGPPLGIGPSTYESTTLVLPPGAALIAYTDGLVERRAEHIDDGTARLVAAVRRLDGMPLADLVPQLLDACRDPEAADDIAVLAMRRLSPEG